MGVSYNRNVSLALDAELTLLRRRHTQSLYLSQNVELLKLAWDARHRVTQTHVRHETLSCSDPCETQSYSDPREARDVELLSPVYKVRIAHGGEVRVLVKMW